jgi:predicted esterase
MSKRRWQFAFIGLLAGLAAAWWAWSPPAQAQGKVVEKPGGLVYLPDSLQEGRRYPIVFAFSPSGDAGQLIRFWRPVADQNHWIIFASKEFRNYIDMNALYPVMKSRVDTALAQLPADKSRVVFTGMSGGGSFSHAMNFEYPGLASALIVNTGRIWEDVLERALEQPNANWGNSRKLIVFLASPGDFRYQEMQRDRQLLAQRGWKVQWIEFPGGHVHAPQSVYEQAIQWITAQPAWK